jgi:hypothetical protein
MILKNKLSNNCKPISPDCYQLTLRISIFFVATHNNEPPTRQVLNLNITNKEEIIRTINSIGTPEGGTPISAAIRASVTTLKEYAANDKKIILVTDGQKSSGGDYVVAARVPAKDLCIPQPSVYCWPEVHQRHPTVRVRVV